ncbi:hypothetical protein M0657_010734 [Pyricularia oryzae]|nr:hypothetical protein M0657_010734 [Pyricularia oryzae]
MEMEIGGCGSYDRSWRSLSTPFYQPFGQYQYRSPYRACSFCAPLAKTNTATGYLALKNFGHENAMRLVYLDILTVSATTSPRTVSLQRRRLLRTVNTGSRCINVRLEDQASSNNIEEQKRVVVVVVVLFNAGLGPAH